MGYRQRGLTYEQMQAQGRKIAKQGGTPREYALMIAEDNFSKVDAKTPGAILAKTTREAIFNKVDKSPLPDIRDYDFYLQFARRLYEQGREIRDAVNIYKRSVDEITLRLENAERAEEYAFFIKGLYPELKARGEDYIEEAISIGNSFSNTRLTEKPDKTGIKIELWTNGDYHKIETLSFETEMNLRRVLLFKRVLETILEEEDLADFIPDSSLELIRYFDSLSFPEKWSTANRKWKYEEYAKLITKQKQAKQNRNAAREALNKLEEQRSSLKDGDNSLLTSQVEEAIISKNAELSALEQEIDNLEAEIMVVKKDYNYYLIPDKKETLSQIREEEIMKKIDRLGKE